MAPAAYRWSRSSQVLLLRQGEDVDRTARSTLVDIQTCGHQVPREASGTSRDSNILAAIHFIGHCVTRSVRTEARAPQQVSGFGVEGLEVAVATTGEQQVASSRHHRRVLCSRLRPAPDRLTRCDI